MEFMWYNENDEWYENETELYRMEVIAMFELNDMTKSEMWDSTACGPSDDGSDDWTDDEIADEIADDYGVDDYDDCGPAEDNW